MELDTDTQLDLLLKKHLEAFSFWNHFITNFDAPNIHIYHFLCPRAAVVIIVFNIQTFPNYVLNNYITES